MITFSFFPRRVTLFVFARNPCTASSVHKVLGTQYVYIQEQLWVFYRAVYMTFGSEVHKIVDIVFSKQLINQFSVAYVAFHKDASFVVYVFFNCTKIASVS